MSSPRDTDLINSSQTRDIAQQIVSMLQGIRFGSIEIVVHDGRIVQIDKYEKFRLKNSATD